MEQSDLDTWYERSLKPDGLITALRSETNRIRIRVLDTCSQDGIFQALAWQYIGIDHFRKAIEGSADDTDSPRLIAALAEQGATDNTYRLRSELLSKRYEATSKGGLKIIPCQDFFVENLENFVTHLFPSMTSTSGCGCRIEEKFIVLPDFVVSRADDTQCH